MNCLLCSKWFFTLWRSLERMTVPGSKHTQLDLLRSIQIGATQTWPETMEGT